MIRSFASRAPLAGSLAGALALTLLVAPQTGCAPEFIGDDPSGAGGAGGAGDPSATGTATGPATGTATGTGTGTGTGTTSATGTGGSGQGGGGAGGAGSTSSGGDPCDSTDDEDRDGDGFSKAQGDCSDCDELVNPGAIEVLGEDPVDDDCDGRIDNVPDATCDDRLALASTDAVEGARAIEICKEAAGPGDWGLLGAAYMGADGSTALDPLQFGLQAAFGPNVAPRSGGSMVALSSGRARTPGQTGACGACDCGQQPGATPDPLAFPQSSPECGGGPGSPVFDDIALQVQLRAPTNATGFSFDFAFYTFEYPDYICAAVNDQFIAWMQPPPVGVPNGNISIDGTGNAISVNAAFFQVCAGCVLGEAQLLGTGFDVWTCLADDGNAGGTGWLRTQAPVVGGEEITLRFAIWDTGDGILDSTTLVDNFRWIANGRPVVLQTGPVPADDPG